MLIQIYKQQNLTFTHQDTERILKRYIHAHTFPEYSQEERAEYQRIEDIAKHQLLRRSYPFKALAGNAEPLIVLGPVDRFEPYKTACKGQPEDPKWLMVEDVKREKSIRSATQLRDALTDSYLIPRPKEPKSKRRISGGFDKVLRKAQGRKPMEDMSRMEIVMEVREAIINDFLVSKKQLKNRDIDGYIIERSCDPLDPLNEVFKILAEKRNRTCSHTKYLSKDKPLISDRSSLK